MTAKESERLSRAVSHLLQECRMVLPGIQALFGFQLIAVFEPRFVHVPFDDQVLHLAAVALVALSAALAIAPAAVHRQAVAHGVSERLLRISTLLLLTSMFFLALGISIDFFIIAAFIFKTRLLPVVAAALLFLALVSLWFVFPQWRRWDRP